MDEFTQYQLIKNAFTVEEGKVLFIVITSENISELVPELILNNTDISKRALFNGNRNQPYALFDYLNHDKLVFAFNGKTFMKAEVVETGELLSFAEHSQEQITAEDIKKDFAQLRLMLESKKAC